MKSKSKKLTGTVHHVDLEGGYFTLRLAGGEVFKLDGGGADLRQDGVLAPKSKERSKTRALASALALRFSRSRPTKFNKKRTKRLLI